MIKTEKREEYQGGMTSPDLTPSDKKGVKMKGITSYTPPKKELISKQGIRLEFGWTDRIILLYLPEADRIVYNPHYKCAPQMHLYNREFIIKVMETESFKNEFQKTLLRREKIKSTKAFHNNLVNN